MIFAKKIGRFPPNFVHLHNEMVSLVIGVGFKVDAEKYITRFSFGINYNVKIIFSIMSAYVYDFKQTIDWTWRQNRL